MTAAALPGRARVETALPTAVPPVGLRLPGEHLALVEAPAVAELALEGEPEPAESLELAVRLEPAELAPVGSAADPVAVAWGCAWGMKRAWKKVAAPAPTTASGANGRSAFARPASHPSVPWRCLRKGNPVIPARSRRKNASTLSASGVG